MRTIFISRTKVNRDPSQEDVFLEGVIERGQEFSRDCFAAEETPCSAKADATHEVGGGWYKHVQYRVVEVVARSETRASALPPFDHREPLEERWTVPEWPPRVQSLVDEALRIDRIAFEDGER